MSISTQLLRLRALAAVIGWLPLLLDAKDAGGLLVVLPVAGLLAGVLPVTWFPVVGPAQLALAGATLWLSPRLVTSGGWLSSFGLGLALLLNAGLWRRDRVNRGKAAPAERGCRSGAGRRAPDGRLGG